MIINNTNAAKKIIKTLNQSQLLEITRAWVNAIWGNNTLVYGCDNEIWYSYWPIAMSPPALAECSRDFLFGLKFSERPNNINQGLEKLKNLLAEHGCRV